MFVRLLLRNACLITYHICKWLYLLLVLFVVYVNHFVYAVLFASICRKRDLLFNRYVTYTCKTAYNHRYTRFPEFYSKRSNILINYHFLLNDLAFVWLLGHSRLWSKNNTVETCFSAANLCPYDILVLLGQWILLWHRIWLTVWLQYRFVQIVLYNVRWFSLYMRCSDRRL